MVQFALVNPSVLAWNDESDHLLAPIRVRPPHHGGFQHALVLEQHLLDLARINVRAPTDDHVLQAVLQSQKTLLIHDPDVARVQPAAPQGFGGGFRILPISRHHHIPPHRHLARRAGRQGVVFPVNHAHLHVGAGDAGGAQPRLVVGMGGIRMVGFPECGDGHGGFALPENLHQFRPERAQGPLQVGQVHGATAVNDGFEIGGVGGFDLPAVQQPGEHGGRREKGDSGILRNQLKNFGRIEMTAFRNDVVRALGEVGQGITAGGVGERSGVDDAILGADLIDVGEITEGHDEQVAVGQYRALGPPGGSAGVKEPSRSGGVHRFHFQRGPLQHGQVVLAAGANDPLQGGQLLDEGSDGRFQIGSDETQPRAGLGKNVMKFPLVQLGVDGHRGQAGMP